MKDINNKVDYNVWSGTEYLKNTNSFLNYNNSIIYSTNEWSEIGESSLKIIRTDTSKMTSAITRILNLTGTNTINTSLRIYSENNPAQIALYDGDIYTSVIIPKSTEKFISLSKTITSDHINLQIGLYDIKDYCFIDNILITYNEEE